MRIGWLFLFPGGENASPSVRMVYTLSFLSYSYHGVLLSCKASYGLLPENSIFHLRNVIPIHPGFGLLIHFREKRGFLFPSFSFEAKEHKNGENITAFESRYLFIRWKSCRYGGYDGNVGAESGRLCGISALSARRVEKTEVSKVYVCVAVLGRLPSGERQLSLVSH